MREVSLMSIPMHAATMKETLACIERRIEHRVFTQHVVINVAKLVHMQRDAQLRESVERCELINVDGMGIIWGARFLGIHIPERVAGVDLFEQLLALAARKGYPVFLLGAKPEVVERAARVCTSRHPGLIIAGWHHGYFTDEREVVEKIRASGARLLFVAITSPRKEIFINRWREALGVDFAMGVGGTFDIVAGEVRRAPLWMQRCGLEWFHRVLQEPRRMAWRYLSTNTQFAWMLLKARFGRNRNGAPR